MKTEAKEIKEWEIEDDARTLRAYAELCADKRRKKLAEEKLKKQKKEIDKALEL